MPYMKPANYEIRNVRDSLILANSGKIALPNFQRSYVWQNQRIADYLMALFDNRPTGIFLSLPVQGELTFESRTIKGVSASAESAVELLLDGQQRITSLWNVFAKETKYDFYVRVEDLKNRKMDVREVIFYSENSTKGKEYQNPIQAYEANLVPIGILADGYGIVEVSEGTDPDDQGPIWNWCIACCGSGDSEARKLEHAINQRLQQVILIERSLYYCILPDETDPNVAIDIFVETNQSSATIRMFDIVVALAQGKHKEDLRNRIVDFQNTAPVTQHYFSRDEEKMIPEIGEWLLKVACLKVQTDDHRDGLPPKEQNYKKALDSMFVGGQEQGMVRLDELQKDLEQALVFVAQRGGTTQSTLPAWPPVHVIAALQEVLRSVRKPEWQWKAMNLISAYLWRSYLTDRYEAQANDRLFSDFLSLRKCILEIANNGSYQTLPPIFDVDEHPLPRASDLEKSLNWISRGRLGLAVAAVAMQKTPKDWVTGGKLDENRVRELEDLRKLDRHHVFPKRFLKDHISSEEINHGLNGVLLSKEGNLALGTKSPDTYLNKILSHSQGLSEDDLRTRIESHLVPYDDLISTGSPKSRYRKYLKSRAKIVAEEIVPLVTP